MHARPASVATFFLLLGVAQAQIGVETSTALTAPELVGARIQSVVASTSGDLHVAGAVGSDPAAQTAFVAKLSSSGVVAWTRTLATPPGASTSFQTLVVDASGSVSAAGAIAMLEERDAIVARYDADGTLVWATTFADAGSDERVRALAIEPDGSLLAVGAFGSTTGAAAQIARLGLDGAIDWTSAIATSANPELLHVASDGLGAAYVCGSSAPTVFGKVSLVARLSVSNGAVEWERTEAPFFNANLIARKVVVEPSGGVRAMSEELSAPASPRRFGVIAYAPTSTLLWSSAVNASNGAPEAEAKEIVLLPDGGVATSAQGRFGGTGTDLFTIVWNADGTLRWSSTYAFPGLLSFEYSHALFVDDDGDLITVGSVVFPGEDLVVRCHTLEGAHKWTRVLTSGAFGGGSPQRLAVELGARRLAITGIDVEGRALVAIFAQHARKLCVGDGAGASCPCGNASAAIEHSGCASSLGLGGELDERGTASLSADSLVLAGSGMPDSSVLYFQGSASVGSGLGAAFGDGLRCAGGDVLRLATKWNAGGTSQFPAAGDQSVSVRGAVAAPGTRVYQAWYRNAADFCTSSTFNLTNGLEVRWDV